MNNFIQDHLIELRKNNIPYPENELRILLKHSLLIDNDMCGAILRTVRGIEIRDDFFDIESIERVVSGDGHYLGEPQTLQLMKTEYVYPNLGDRKSVADWLDTGSESIWHRAQKRVQNILAENESTHLNPQRDRKIRQSFNIKLPGAND